eukprot:20853_1
MITMNHFPPSAMKQRRPKQKIEKSNEEFKEHERIIMDKRIAEINNVITKKCHTLWNQYLYFKKKPHTLQFHFVYHGLESYLAKCDEYKAEQHKDNKQKWWNNQKASEMSQQFLPSVLNSTDHMASYLGKQIESNLQVEFTNYVIFELLETAITSVFSTQRSGSNEVFLRTSFQYAKAGLRKKLVSYFGDGELREYDTKSRKKKDLWQRLIKDKKEKLVQILLHKKSIYSCDSKVGIVSDIDSMTRMGLYDKKQYLYADTSTNNGNTNNGNCSNEYMMNQVAPPSTQQQQFDHNNYDYNGYTTYATTAEASINNGNNLALMDGLNAATLPFPQPLLMDITLTYPHHQPRVTPAAVPTKTAYSQHTIHNSHQLHHNQCRQCLEYMSKISELLKVNQAINDDSAQLKQVNIKYEAERDHWKSQYQQLFKQYQTLLRQNNELQKDDEDSQSQTNDDQSFSNMSVSSKTDTHKTLVPLDDLTQNQFMTESTSITPYDATINPFPFPTNNKKEETQQQHDDGDKQQNDTFNAQFNAEQIQSMLQ